MLFNKNNNNYNFLWRGLGGGTFLVFLLTILLTSCEPYQDPEIELGATPTANFSYTPNPENPNQVIFTDESAGAFQRVWDFGNGLTSKAQTDTAYYPFAGDYLVRLTVSAQGGSAAAEEMISITTNDASICTDSTLINLAGGCDSSANKAWTFSFDAEAVAVGPVPGSTEWFTSPAGGLEDAQYDDSFIFYFQDNVFEYDNNGQTVFPELGYEIVDYDPPTGTSWALVDNGPNGYPQIVLAEGMFMGVKDSGPVYDILEISEERLVVQSPILNQDEGWFTLTFISN